ncbi:Serine/threonine protein phosphatase PP2A family [Halapricum desulfuricans]|uniref:Serine/threonine protein phosphatase PP2A family n=1 Tax=Halapricum desulfuricans TaxID=2841257 RepID=A0A897N2U5_9EURY|nr:Serine/threonine protein phosphatase PP2A family [Halapricum desulfuricans]
MLSRLWGTNLYRPLLPSTDRIAFARGVSISVTTDAFTSNDPPSGGMRR